MNNRRIKAISQRYLQKYFRWKGGRWQGINRLLIFKNPIFAKFKKPLKDIKKKNKSIVKDKQSQKEKIIS